MRQFKVMEQQTTEQKKAIAKRIEVLMERAGWWYDPLSKEKEDRLSSSAMALLKSIGFAYKITSPCGGYSRQIDGVWYTEQPQIGFECKIFNPHNFEIKPGDFVPYTYTSGYKHLSECILRCLWMLYGEYSREV